MSTRNSSAGRNRFFDCFCVFAVTVISISALFFIGCKQRFFFILPGMGFLMFAMVAGVHLCQSYCELVSRRWPETVGFMRCVRIVRTYTGRGHAGNSSPTFDYYIEVDYDYGVKGRRYKGKRVSFVGKVYNSWKDADCARRPFLQNKNIKVYYCPLIPSLSCIAHVHPRDIVISLSAAGAASVVLLACTLLAFYCLP